MDILVRTSAAALRREDPLNSPVDDGGMELVARARDGDRVAFGALYERYAPVVHGVLLSLVRPGEAQDLVHDVFLTALRALEQLEDDERFGPWLATIARNRGRDLLRSRGRDIEELTDDAAPTLQAEDELGESEEAARALAAIRSLPDAYRETLVLRLVEGLSGEEIARRIGMTHGSVRVNLCRGMKLLRDKLEREIPS